MHDPLVVAFEVPAPWPRRSRWREGRLPRWGLNRRRRTNTENLGEPVYRWWRLQGYEPTIAGRCYGLATLLTIWHREPGGRDMGEVCKHRRQRADGTWHYTNRWKWHAWHWHIQFHWWQKWRRFLFDRCDECKQRFPLGYSPIGTWGGEKHWHHECSSLDRLRAQKKEHDALLVELFHAYRLALDLSTEEAIERLRRLPGDDSLRFRQTRALTHLLGYERDDNYQLVPKGSDR